MSKFDAIKTMRSAAVEQMDWAFLKNESMSFDSIMDSVRESIDSCLIYTSDILAIWNDYGMPEPENAEFRDFDSIGAAIAFAAYESLSSESEEIIDALIDRAFEIATDRGIEFDENADIDDMLAAIESWRDDNEI